MIADSEEAPAADRDYDFSFVLNVPLKRAGYASGVIVCGDHGFAPACIVATGDLTETGAPAEYERLREIL